MQNSEKQKHVATPKDPFNEITFSADDPRQGESSQNSAPDLLTQQQTILDERENQEMPRGVLKVKPEEEFVNNISKTKEKLKEANHNKFIKQFEKYKNLSNPLRISAGIGVASIISGLICLICRQDLACYVLVSSSLVTLWGPMVFSKFKIGMATLKFLRSRDDVLESSLLVNQPDKPHEMNLFDRRNFQKGLEARFLDIKSEQINMDKISRPGASEPNSGVAPLPTYKKVSGKAVLSVAPGSI